MILSAQYMRAIAALMVVIHHSFLKETQFGSNELGLFNIGNAGVDLFFIISGFVMCHTADSRNLQFFGFMKARVLRIIPLYWVLTTLALIAFLVFPEKINTSGGSTNIINSYLLFPTDEKFLINNGWTLSYVFFFYILFSLSLGLTAAFRYLAVVSLILILVIFGEFVTIDSFLMHFVTNPLLLEFAIGILIYYLYKHVPVNLITGLLLIVTSVILIALVDDSEPDNSRVIHYGFPALLFFIGMLSLETLFKNYHTNKISMIMKGIGDSSYSLYLFHPFTLVIVSVVLNKVEAGEYGYVFISILVMSSVVSGYLCSIWIEKRLQKIFKKRNVLLKVPT